VKSRSLWIAGRATFTIDASTTIISCPRQTITRAIQRRRAESPSILAAMDRHHIRDDLSIR
jgi:hypothetical protein